MPMSRICKKAFYHIRRISRIKKFLFRSSIFKLLHSFVFSHLDYCNSILVGLSSSSIDRLQRVQNCAARLVTGARRFDSITPHLKSLHWLPIKQMIEYKIAFVLFHCLNSCALFYLTCIHFTTQPAPPAIRPGPSCWVIWSSRRSSIPHENVWWPSFLRLRPSNLECATWKHSFIQFPIPIQIPPQNPLFSLGIWISQSSV